MKPKNNQKLNLILLLFFDKKAAKVDTPKSRVQVKMENNIVAQSNDLITAVYSTTLKEKVLLLACMSQIDSREGAKLITPQTKFVVTVEQMRGLFYDEKNHKNAYRDLSSASTRLKRREVTISLDDGKSLLTEFVSGVLFDPNNAQVTLTFAEDILPYLTQLKSNFSKYKLVDIKDLSSTHAIRLYELMTYWIGTNKYSITLDLDDFRYQMGVANKYKQFGQLRSYVIDKAISEINEHTSYRVKVSFRKVQKTYVSMTLNFYKKQSLLLTDDAGKISKDKISAIVRTKLFMADYNDHKLLSVEARDSNEAFWAAAEKLLLREPDQFSRRDFDEYFDKGKTSKK